MQILKLTLRWLTHVQNNLQLDGARFYVPLTGHKSHFGDVLPSQSLGSALKKLTEEN